MGIVRRHGQSIRCPALSIDPLSAGLHHRRALLEVAQEIDTVGRANRDLLSRGQQAAREALATIGQIEIDSYTPKGAAAAGSLGMRLIDEAI